MTEEKREIISKEDLPYVLMDRADEDQIVAELKGAVLDKFVYHFPQKNKEGKVIGEVWGLSKAGIDEATREMAKRGEVIRELESSYQIINGECLFEVKAGRFIVGQEGREILMETKFGRKRQSLIYEDGRPNPFWFEQAGAKASRNAKQSLIPEEMKQSVIAAGKEKGKVRELKENEEVKSGIPGKEDRTITEPQRKRLFAIYKTAGYTDDQIKAWLKKTYFIESSKDILMDYYEDLCSDIQNGLVPK